MECAICLNSVRETRSTPRLDFNHVFHSHCFDTWKSRGGTTCPLCRDHIRKSLYRVYIKIENCETGEEHSNVTERRMGGQDLQDLEITEIIMDVDSLNEIYELVDRGFFGLTRADFDAIGLNTE